MTLLYNSNLSFVHSANCKSLCFLTDLCFRGNTSNLQNSNTKGNYSIDANQTFTYMTYRHETYKEILRTGIHIENTTLYIEENLVHICRIEKHIIGRIYDFLKYYAISRRQFYYILLISCLQISVQLQTIIEKTWYLCSPLNYVQNVSLE